MKKKGGNKMVKCGKCKTEKIETDFYPSSLTRLFANQIWCKKCTNEYSKNYTKTKRKELKILQAENYLLKIQIEKLTKRGE